MNTENQIPNRYGRPSGTNGSYLKCKQWALKFGDAKNLLLKLLASKDEMLAKMVDTPSGFKKFTAIVAILIGLGLSLVEAINIANVLAAAIGVNATLAAFIGAIFSALGMLAGEKATNSKKDEFTGRHKITMEQVGGFTLVITYLVMQYLLARQAEVGAGDTNETVHSMTGFIVGIAVLEVVFGAMFLRTAIQVLSLLILNIRIRIAVRKLNQSSRHTAEAWERHVFEVQMHNEVNSTNLPHGELTPKIQEALDYYNSDGFTDEQNNNSSSN